MATKRRCPPFGASPEPLSTLTVRKAGGDALEYLVVKMEQVLITSFQTSAPFSVIGQLDLMRRSSA